HAVGRAAPGARPPGGPVDRHDRHPGRCARAAGPDPPPPPARPRDEPPRQRPGLGTISNVVVLGLAMDATLAVVPAPSSIPLRIGLLVTGVLLNAVATAAYIAVHLGPGPRDGLRTGLVRRTGGPVPPVRTSIAAP